MDEKKLTHLSLLCCTFGLALLFFLAEHNEPTPTPLPALKSVDHRDAVVSGKVIAVKPLPSHVQSHMNGSQAKQGFILDIRTNDLVSAIILNSDQVPVQEGDQVEVRGNIRFEQKKNQDKAALFAAEVRVVS